MATSQDVPIVKILLELGEEDFRLFKWFLCKYNTIPWSQLEKADLVNTSVKFKETYPDPETAREILMNILKDLNRNDLVKEFSLTGSPTEVTRRVASQTMDTEKYLPTCLQIKLHHPQQSSRELYRLLPVGSRQKHPAEDPLRIGRDGQACTFALDDNRVSRKQLAFQAYRRPNDGAEMRFSLQNLSQKGRVYVDGSVLGYLERKDLPDKALVRFLDYEVLIVRVSGEATASFEVEFEVLMTPPSREMVTEVISMTPVMDTGSPYHCLTTNGFPSDLSSGQGSMEAD